MNAALLHDDDQPLRIKVVAEWLGGITLEL